MGTCLSSCITKESTSQTAANATATAASAAAAAATSCLRRQATDEQDSELISNTSEQQQRCRRRSFIYRILKFKRKKKYAQFIDKYLTRQDTNYVKLSNGNGADSGSDIQLQNLDAYKLLNSSTLAKESELNGYARAFSSRASSSLDLEWEHEYSQLRQQYKQSQKHLQHHQQHYEYLPHSTHTAINQSAVRHHYRKEEYASRDPMPGTPTSAQGAYVPLPEPTMEQNCTNVMPATSRISRFTRTSTRQSSRTSACSSQNSWSHISTPESLEWDTDAEQEQQRQLRLEDDNLDVETLKLLHQIEQLKNHVLQETGEGLFEESEHSEQYALEFDVTHFGGTASIGGSATGLEAHIS